MYVDLDQDQILSLILAPELDQDLVRKIGRNVIRGTDQDLVRGVHQDRVQDIIRALTQMIPHPVEVIVKALEIIIVKTLSIRQNKICIQISKSKKAISMTIATCAMNHIKILIYRLVIKTLHTTITNQTNRYLEKIAIFLLIQE